LELQKKKAHKWVARQRRRGRVKVVGIVQRRDTGRPEIVYGKRCKATETEHEVRITDLALHFRDWPFIRGEKVGRAEPDALMVMEGHRVAIEVDNSGKMAARQMAAKWERYQGGSEDILVIAMTEGRMERLRKGAEAVKDRALFTTFARLRSGSSAPWIDWYGKTTNL
jgi:hypothetical protein